MRQEFLDILAPLPSGLFVATSGGISSAALLASAVEAGKQPRVVSFTFDDFESTDYVFAKQLARFYGCEFYRVALPSSPQRILNSVRRLIRQYRLTKKARIECSFPFLYVAERVKGNTLVTGLCDDGHFGLSKKAMIHCRYPQEKFDAFRQEYFSNPDAAGQRGIRAICTSHQATLVNPYFDSRIFNLFIGRSWDELNKPRQKEAIRAAYPELDRFKLPRHSNLQLGDSKIAERLGAAAMAAVPGSRSPIGAYNQLRKQK